MLSGKFISKILKVGSTLLFLLGFIGCAQDVSDIDRTQPNKLKKSLFQGDWYYRQTVADVPATFSQWGAVVGDPSFIGESSKLEKIRWEIQEKQLIGYRTYELVPGIDIRVDQENKEIGDTDFEKGMGEGRVKTVYKEAPVVAFEISGHFDVKREYNAATGEQTNVITENGSDRPWYEREYFRVDWSSNKIKNFDFFNPVTGMDLVQYVQENEKGEDAFYMECDSDEDSDDEQTCNENGSGLKYFDSTSRYFLQGGGTITEEYEGTVYSVPGCWASMYPGYSSSVIDCTDAEVKIRHSFMRINPKNDFQPRFYSDQDMSKFGYFRTERFAYDRKYGLKESNRIYLANIHNLWEKSVDEDGKVIPEKDRVPKPVVYALGGKWPEALCDSALAIADSWNSVFKEVVATAQGKSVDKVPDMFVLYKNGMCGDKNPSRYRIGDLRYHTMYWVDEDQSAGPLGYGPSAVDPETGEIVSGTAHVYGAAIDRYSQTALEYVKILNDELDLNDIIKGANVKEYIEKHLDPTDPRNQSILHNPKLANIPMKDLSKTLLKPKALERVKTFAEKGIPNHIHDFYKTQIERIRGTLIENLLTTNEDVLTFTGGNPDATNLIKDPTEWAIPNSDDEIREKIWEQRAASRNICMSSFMDNTILSLAREFKKLKTEDPEKWTDNAVYQAIRHRLFKAVMEHEIGHTIGLRHNFQGSYDSINFFSKYWDLRKENLAQVTTTDEISKILSDMSELTEAQIDGQMRLFQYSTVMDYGAGFASDIMGVGKYDLASLMFGYANKVEVFKEVSADARKLFTDPNFENHMNPYVQLLDTYHYTQIPYLLGEGNVDTGIQRLLNREWVDWDSLKKDQKNNEEDRKVEVPYMFCSDEWVNATASCNRWDEGADPFEISQDLINRYKGYYFFNNFKRDSITFTPYSTYGRVLGRYFMPLTNVYKHFFLYWIRNYSVLNDPNMALLWNYYMAASIDGLNLLGNVASTPSYGSYKSNNKGQYVWYSYRTDLKGYVPIERGVGRSWYSDWDINDGYYYFNKVQEAGNYIDYRAALNALIDSDISVRGQDTSADFASYSISYTYLFEDSIHKLFDGLWTLDYEDFAPRILFNGEDWVYQPYNIADPEEAKTDQFKAAGAIDLGSETTGGEYVRQYLTHIYGMLFLSRGLDLTFPTRNQIFRIDGDEAVEVGSGFKVISFTDPFTGYQYAARSPDVGVGEEIPKEQITPAIKIILKGQELAKKIKDQNISAQSSLGYELNNLIDLVNLSRGLYSCAGDNLFSLCGLSIGAN